MDDVGSSFTHLAERAGAFFSGPVVHVLKECEVDGFEVGCSRMNREWDRVSRRPGRTDAARSSNCRSLSGSVVP